LTKELTLIRAVNAGIEAVAPFVRRFEPPSYLGADQCKALAHILTSPDQFTGFRGLAGSGKTTLLKELARVLDGESRPCLFCAPTASAVDTLRRDGLEAMTLQRLVGSIDGLMRLSPRSVVVLDEAGAVGLDDMVELFKVVRRKACRVVFSGDTGQHSSVPRGDALRILEQYSGYRFSELTTIRRQKPAAFREAVELAAAKQTDKAFAKLVELRVISEIANDDGQLYQQAATAYVSAIKQGRSALLVSPTWAEIEAVTEKVRESLKADGIISQDESTHCVFDSFSWTAAQKKNFRQYGPGQRLRFIRQTKKFNRGETVEVVAQPEAGHNMLRVRRMDGSEASFKLGAGSVCFDVGAARELKVAAGDWLLLQANHGKEFINGERVQVKRLAGGAIELADGRVLPAGYNTFTHGYAVTSHSSQGKTVDDVLLVASSKSFPAVNREQFYVSISRGRESVQIFTDDTELLARRITDSHERKAAVELTELRQELVRLGFKPKACENTTPPTVALRKDFRTVRSMRMPMANRRHHITRLSPVQKLAQVVEDVRRWLGLEHTATVANEQAAKAETTEAVKQAEKISPSIKPEKPVAVKPRMVIKPPAPPRQSRGIRI
jgi:ATP-dependent exoDNAse (exonuclease V) alpha subunit